MSMRRGDVGIGNKVKYTAYVLGDNDMLIAPRSFDRSAPTNGDLARMLLEFNYQRDEQWMYATVVVVRTETRMGEEREYTLAGGVRGVRVMVERRREEMNVAPQTASQKAAQTATDDEGDR